MAAWLLATALAAFTCITWTIPTASAQQPADLELVLAVDVSLSMDLEEQRLQRDGYVRAFRDADLIGAIMAGQHRRIIVIYVEWAGSLSQQTVVPWTVIDSPAASHAFATRLEQQPISRYRMTSISGALQYAARQFGKAGFQGVRRVIDVSGDGPNNAGAPIADVRDSLIREGIVINGLPILLKAGTASAFFDIANLDTYYHDCVIGGDGAFLIPVTSRDEFASATRRKLIQEISGFDPPARIIKVQTQSGPAPPGAAGTTDCLIGEKLWQRYMGDRWSP
jgi:hypothetical protein